MKNYQFILSKRDREKGLILPSNISEDLVELVGIHFGDGSMGGKHVNTYRLRYSFNSRDEQYIEYVKNLFFKVFNVRLKSFENNKKHYIELWFDSKCLCDYLNKTLEVPYSPKTNLRIPAYIIKNKLYMVRFIRGLFDTDGCFTSQKDKGYVYPLIKICTSIDEFSIQIKEGLELLGIKSYICRKKEGFDIVVRRKESYNKFLEVIKPKNMRM